VKFCSKFEGVLFRPLCIRTKLYVVGPKLSSMGGSDSPPPTIIIEVDVEQDTGLQNNLPKSSKVKIELLGAIIGLALFIFGVFMWLNGLYDEGFWLAIIGFFIIFLLPIHWAAKKVFFEKIVNVEIASNEVDDRTQPEIKKMHKSIFLTGMVLLMFGGIFNDVLDHGYKMNEGFFVPVCMGYFMVIFSGLLVKNNNYFRRIMKWGMKIFITIFIPVMVIFFVLDLLSIGPSEYHFFL